jgi:hypothetical protein
VGDHSVVFTTEKRPQAQRREDAGKFLVVGSWFFAEHQTLRDSAKSQQLRTKNRELVSMHFQFPVLHRDHFQLQDGFDVLRIRAFALDGDHALLSAGLGGGVDHAQFGDP